MRIPAALTRVGPAQLGLRAVIAGGVVLALLASWPVRPDPWLLATVAALAVGFAVAPESPAGATAMVVVVGWWAAAVPDPHPAGVLLAALALLLAHVAATLASYGPVGLRVDGPLVRRWGARTLACSAVVGLVWIAVLVLGSRPASPAAWPVAVLVVVAAVLGAVGALRHDRAGS